MDINTYLKGKLKERNLQLEELIARSGSSKSTIYRVMTGTQKPSEKLTAKIIQILKLNYKEQKELLYYFSISNMDEYVIEAREALYDFLFKEKVGQVDKIELVYYDDEKYIRTYNNILESILEVSQKDNFSCEFKLINCISNSIIVPLSDLVSELMANKSEYTVEHLVNFSTYDYKNNINVLSNIIPLLTVDHYSLKYREEDNVPNHGFFHDFLMINYSYCEANGNEINTTLYITFLANNLSACYVIRHTANALDFFGRNYDSLEKEYQPALSSRKNLLEYVKTVIEMYSKHEVVAFTSQILFSRVPFNVFESVMARTTSMDEFLDFFFPESYQEKDKETQVSYLRELLTVIYEGTFVNKQLDIYTKSGMSLFASTGTLTDHLEFLPAFNKEEVKEILESIKARDLDPKDPFNFAILKESFSDPSLCFLVEKNGALLVEKYIDSYTPFCMIKKANLSGLFIDFAYNYVPAMLAISRKEAHDFIDDLIERYC